MITRTNFLHRVLYYGSMMILLGIAAFLCFNNLGAEELSRWDEQTNSAIVRNVQRNGTFVLYYNNAPFFEKPPVWYIASAYAVRMFGFSEAVLRLISSVSGYVLLILTAVIANRMFGKLASLICLITLLTTNHLFVTNAGGYFSTHHIRSADPDMLHIFLMVVSYYFFYLVTKGRAHYIYLAGIASALSVLTKGPLGMLPVTLFALYQLCGITHTSFDGKKTVQFILIYIGIVSPWYVLMMYTFGTEFIRIHILYHIGLRMITPLEGHSASWWYYVVILSTLSVFPWGGVALVRFVSVITNRQLLTDYRYFSLIGMILSILGITAIVQTKLAWYILPIYPFLSLLIASQFDDTKE